MVGTTFWGKHGWQHILGINMIGRTFWEKTWLAAHFGKNKHD
jgi:hypothetical protein